MKKCFDFYLNAHIHIGLSAGAFMLVAAKLLQINCKMLPVLLVLITAVVYNVMRFFKIKKSLHTRTLDWYQKNKRGVKILNVLLTVIFLWVALTRLALEIFLKIAVGSMPFIILTIWYVLPIRPFGKLRSLPYVKIFIIATVWVGCGVGLPIFLGAGFGIDVFLFLLAQWFFMIALTLPFDMRDRTFDKQNHLKTIPTKIGIKNTKILALFLLGLVLILHYRTTLKISLIYFIKTIISIGVLGFLIVRYKPSKKASYTAFWIESIPIFWAGLLYL